MSTLSSLQEKITPFFIYKKFENFSFFILIQFHIHLKPESFSSKTKFANSSIWEKRKDLFHLLLPSLTDRANMTGSLDEEDWVSQWCTQLYKSMPEIGVLQLAAHVYL